jgi:tetratricopeptide (TPR) repeat protein
LLDELEQHREELLHDPDLSPEERGKLDSVTVSLDLSYQRLRKQHAEAADFFPLLSLFPSGVDERGLEAIFPGAWRASLSRLGRHSLVEREPPTRRYFLPTPIRHYAERKQPADALARYGPAALQYYLALTRYADELLPGPHYEEGMILLGLELANIHTFLDWGYEGEKGEGQVSLAARLTAALRNFYVMADLQVKEGQRLQKASAAARRADDQEGEANTLQALGDLALRTDDLAGAEQNYQAALTAFRDIGDRLGEANTLRGFGNLHLARNESDKAWQYLTQALEIHQSMEDRYSMAITLPSMAFCLLAAGRSYEARQALETARDLFTEIGLAGSVEWVERMMQQLETSGGEG